MLRALATISLSASRVCCVNTSWAMLALLATGQEKRDAAPLRKAAACLLKKQLPDGDWPQENIMGVFNNNCMCHCVRDSPLWLLNIVVAHGKVRRKKHTLICRSLSDRAW